MLTDPRRLIEIAFYILEPEIDKREISPEEFGSGIGGPQVGALMNAVTEAWICFFLESGSVETAAAIQSTLEHIEKLRKMAAERVSKLNMDDAFSRKLDQDIAKIRKEFESELGK